MASYRLVFKRSVVKDLRRIPKHDLPRVLEHIDTLQRDPRPPGSEKLSGQERYRIRQGVYRVLYEIVDQTLIVTVVKVGHRKAIYRGE